MRILLSLAILFFLATDVFAWDLTYSKGLSAQNAVLYLLIVILFLRQVVGRGGQLGARPFLVAWFVLIGYAILTWLVAALLVKYPGYGLIPAGIQLKDSMIDHFVFFLVFFLGTRTSDEAMSVARAMLIGAVIASFATVMDTSGLINLGYIERDDGRMQGALGESNQYAAYIILMLPAVVAMMVASHGAKRFMWFCGAMVTIVALMMTASRGGLVGILVALCIGAYVYRRFWSVGRLSVWIVATVLLCAILLTVSQSDALLAERVLTQTGSIDVSDASSGRTEIWAGALATMFAKPLALVTGFGWNTYASFPFRFAPHNHYLNLWFNLGLLGLACGSFLLFYSIRLAKRGSDAAVPPARGHLIGYVIGTTALCVAVFFVDLHQPWPYFWAYTGVNLRLALCALQAPAAAAAPAAVRPVKFRDVHGWNASTQPSRFGQKIEQH